MANLQIDEVQQAMNKMMDQLNYDKSWITDDLIHDIQNNPILSQNEHNTQSPEFIKEMMRVLGDHFTKVLLFIFIVYFLFRLVKKEEKLIIQYNNNNHSSNYHNQKQWQLIQRLKKYYPILK